MSFSFQYMPTFRSRQQELVVFGNFAFGDMIVPLLEIVKSKDRTNNAKPSEVIWTEYIAEAKSNYVLIDLPVYIKDSSAMPAEILSFNRTILSNIENRVAFYNSLKSGDNKMIPVVSTLTLKTGESETIKAQVDALRVNFPRIAIRTFTNSLDLDFPEIIECLAGDDILIYDLDTAQPFNPLVRKQSKKLEEIKGTYKVVLRSAVNTEIQNTKLDHGEIIAEADNSLCEVFHSILGADAFGDYAGIKKDDLNAGGTISPGFIFYDPVDNLYYGYKGVLKELSQFEITIVPAVLDSQIVQIMTKTNPQYVDGDNVGMEILRDIRNGKESGKSQAKFKRISMEHYLHCIKVGLASGKIGYPL